MTINERDNEIISAARITVRPENRKELSLTISSLLDLIRNEAGCRSYRYYKEADDRNSFILVGEWETKDAWDRHLHSDNFAVLVGSLKLLTSQQHVEFKLLTHVIGIEESTRARCEPRRDTRMPVFTN